MKKPGCFISYYYRDDFEYVEKLRKVYERIVVSDYSMNKDISIQNDEQIYENIKFRMNQCAITIVLIGADTGNRKWVDWEIWTSLEPFMYKTKNIEYKDSFKPNGILAIYLPGIKHHCVPKRLQDNIDSGYVVKMQWQSIYNTKLLTKKLFIAYRMRRNMVLINNSRPIMKKNRQWFKVLFKKGVIRKYKNKIHGRTNTKRAYR